VAAIEVEQSELARFCRRRRIRKLSFFGPVLRDDFRSDSDVDCLVEFEPGAVVGYVRLAAIEKELSELLGGRNVDIVNPKFLRPRIRDRVLESAEVQYAEG
jgi:hypothetical protein